MKKYISTFLAFICISYCLFSQNLAVIKSKCYLETQTMEWGIKPTDKGINAVWDILAQGFETISATSILPSGGGYTYGTDNLSDDNPATAWVEGKSDYGIGEALTLKGTVYGNVIVILNGLQATGKLYLANSRVKRFKVSVNGTDLCYVDLEDKMGKQYIELLKYNNESDLVEYRFEIVDIYPGTKYKDTCISEIYTEDVPD